MNNIANYLNLFRLREGGWEKWMVERPWLLLNHCRIAEIVKWTCTKHLLWYVLGLLIQRVGHKGHGRPIWAKVPSILVKNLAHPAPYAVRFAARARRCAPHFKLGRPIYEFLDQPLRSTILLPFFTTSKSNY